MKRTLIATVLSVSLMSGFGISTVSADELDGLISVTQNAAPEGVEATTGSHEAIGRRGGGGGGRRGGMRRGGGMRRSGGSRSAGTRRGGGRSGGARRSSGGHTQHASNSHSSHSSRSSSHSSHSQNSRSSKGGNSKSGKNSHASRGSHSGNHRGNRGGHNGGWDGGWDRGGWDGGSWNGGSWNGGSWNGGSWNGGSAAIPVDPIVPVDPVVIDPRPVVITLLNPARTRTSLNYTLGGSQYAIAAGEEATFEDGTQVIAFDRGESYGEARYTLEPGGTYQFVATNHGWDLHTVTADAGTVGTATADSGSDKSSGSSELTMVSGD